MSAEQLSLFEEPAARVETVVEARARIEQAKHTGARCPVCDQYVKSYRRKVNSTQAKALIHLFRAGSWVHVPTDLGNGTETEKMRFWGLVEEWVGVREDGSSHSGWWRITQRGKDWVTGERRFIPKYAVLYDNELVSLDYSVEVTIRDALGSKFSYDELMAGV